MGREANPTAPCVGSALQKNIDRFTVETFRAR
jgi:hypothetical protein